MEGQKPTPVSEMRAKRDVETTEAIRLRLLRLLAEKRCIHCGQTGCWKVYCTRDRVRYVKCRGCQQPDKVVP